jgi:coatomer subunit beta
MYRYFIFLQMVLVLKKEVVKTNNVEHEDTGKYRQILVRTLHQCSIKFSDIAITIIPVVSSYTIIFLVKI